MNHNQLKIVLATPIPVMQIPELQTTAKQLDTLGQVVVSSAATEEALLQLAEEAQVMIVPWTKSPLVTQAVLEKAKQLKLVTATYGGLRQNVDVDAALAHGVKLSCTGPARARSVAEFTLALMLASLLHVCRIHHTMRTQRNFPRFGYTRQLSGRKVGIIGVGHIARDLITLLKPFEVDLAVCSRHLSGEKARELGAVNLTLHELLKRSEVVVVLTGLTDQTVHMIGAHELAMMPDGALIVNTSRGKIIDEKALVNELQKGRLSAALDVFEEEPLTSNSPLRDLPNVVHTAHSANSTMEMDINRWTFAVEEVRRFMKGEPLQYTVYYTASGRAWPQLLRYTDATDKPAWESQLAAFRSYGPMVLDMFDKPATGRTLALRMIYDHRGRQIFNYHRDNSLVMDILHIGATAGLGGPVLRQDGKSLQPTGLKFESVVVTSGPVRSVVRMTLEPWEGAFCRILMTRTASIHAFRPETIVRDEFHVAKLDIPGQFGIGLLKVADMQIEAAQNRGRLLQWHNQGDDIGPVGLGLIMNQPAKSKVVDDGVNRLLLMGDDLQYDHQHTIEFRAFGAWGRGGVIGDFEAFQKLADNVALFAQPLKVTVGSVDKAPDASGK